MSRTPLSLGLVAVAVAVLAVGAIASVPSAAAENSSTAANGESLGVTVDHPPPRVVTIPNTTNYLFPAQEPTRQEYVHTSVDVGGAMSASAERVESDVRERTYRQRVQQTGEDGTVTATWDVALSAQSRLARLDARQEALVRGYTNGTLSQQEFLRQLTRIRAEATETNQLLTSVRRTAEAEVGSLPPALDTRLTELQSTLVALPHPVSQRVQTAVTGQSDPVVFYAEGERDAVVFASVYNDEFHRQTTLQSEHFADQPNQFAQGDQQAITLVVQRATSLYPWAYTGVDKSSRIGKYGPGVYRVRATATDPQIVLSSFISGSTTNVFHEIQHQDPEGLPVAQNVTNSTAALNLTVTTTSETGPMRVGLVENGTDAPVNGTVLVDGQRVGTTGQDGSLWTVRPSGLFRPTVVVDGQRVTLDPLRFN